MYGGKCNIIPLTLSTFRTMLKQAVDAPSKPKPQNIRNLFEVSRNLAKECLMNDLTEVEWFGRITEAANNWLSI